MWKRIAKEISKPPVEGIYSDWKSILSVEGYHQCVYCFVDEVYMGGIRHFHVEHYKPKSKFPSLTNVYSNLYYSCPICNTFKSDDWPNEPDFIYSQAFYPNPSIVDYSDIFSIDHESYFVKGKTFTAKFLIEKLFLNRGQLINYRKETFIDNMIKDERRKLLKNLEIIKKGKTVSSEAIEFLLESVQILNEICTIQDDRKQTILYYTQDISRLK